MKLEYAENLKAMYNVHVLMLLVLPRMALNSTLCYSLLSVNYNYRWESAYSENTHIYALNKNWTAKLCSPSTVHTAHGPVLTLCSSKHAVLPKSSEFPELPFIYTENKHW